MTCLEQSSGVYIEDEHPVKQFILKYSYEGGGDPSQGIIRIEWLAPCNHMALSTTDSNGHHHSLLFWVARNILTPPPPPFFFERLAVSTVDYLQC